MPDSERRGPPSGNARDARLDAPERRVLGTGKVALADSARFKCEPVAGGNIVDMHHVQACIYRRRCAAVHCSRHYRTGRGRPDVRRLQRRGRIKGRDAARMDNTLDVFCEGRTHSIDSSLEVGPVQNGRITDPELTLCRDAKETVAPRNGGT